jgi:hypothetical protein
MPFFTDRWLSLCDSSSQINLIELAARRPINLDSQYPDQMKKTTPKRGFFKLLKTYSFCVWVN